MTRLSARARKILFAAVTEYIASGAAVGSRTLARKYVQDLSPATIRNVLADLEEAGYLLQPHTSAGRVPTEAALRAFIDALTDFQEIPTEQRQRMRLRLAEIFESRMGGEGALRSAGQLLSDMSGAAAVVAVSAVASRKLTQLRFIVTKPNQLLAVLVFSDGLVENRFITVDKPVSEAELVAVHNLLADVVEGRTLGALRDLFARRLADQKSELDDLRLSAFELGRRAVLEVARASGGVVIEGSTRLMELPEYADVDRLKKLVHALQEREHLVQLLDQTIDAGVVTVYIGSESGEELGGASLSLVAAPFGNPDEGAGTVGVLGPTRMDYARVMPLVDATAAAITAALKKGQ